MSEMSFSDRLKNTGRNDACPCGSGKKYKKCHLPQDEETEHKEFLKREEDAKKENSKEKEDGSRETEEPQKGKEKHTKLNVAPYPKISKKNKRSDTNIPRRTGI